VPAGAALTPQEGLALVAATVLGAMVVAAGRNGALSPWASALLLSLAALAALAVLLHMLARWLGG
jgi:hypothetical protein